MAKAVRRRNPGQRAKKSDEPVIIQDEEEQDKEIKQIRRKNDAENKKARRILDGGILVVATMNILEVYKYLAARSFLLALVAVLQTIFILTGFSIDSIPSISKLGGSSDGGHYRFRQTAFLCNALITAGGLASLYNTNTLQISNLTRLGLPLVLHGGSFMQVKGEIETERRLDRLEKARYPMKGA